MNLSEETRCVSVQFFHLKYSNRSEKFGKLYCDFHSSK